MSVEVKVLVIGPTRSGKTSVANFISEAIIPNADNPSLAPYKPTVGCRILECERSVKKGSASVNVSVELWDISGDRKYEDTWPAIRHNGIGLIFVYDGEKNAEDLDFWYKAFAEPMGLKESQCIVFAHHKAAENIRSQKSLPKSFAKIHCVTTCLEHNAATMKDEFDRFLGHLVGAAMEKRERDEASVLTG